MSTQEYIDHKGLVVTNPGRNYAFRLSLSHSSISGRPISRSFKSRRAALPGCLVQPLEGTFEYNTLEVPMRFEKVLLWFNSHRRDDIRPRRGDRSGRGPQAQEKVIALVHAPRFSVPRNCGS